MNSILFPLSIALAYIALGNCQFTDTHMSNHTNEDMMVQGFCTGIGHFCWMYAVRRDCTPTSSRTCDDVCTSPKLKSQDSGLSDKNGRCVGALYVYYDRPIITNTEMLGPKTHTYYDCTSQGCGPNYCCCEFCPISSSYI